MARPGADAPLVGRTDELGRLTDALARAAAGSAGAVLVGGDAGVGKSRLLRALAEAAGARGAVVLAGQCVDLGDMAVPFLPFAEALDDPALAPELAGHPAAQLLTASSAAGRAAATGGEDDGRLQVFDAVSSVLAAVGADRGPVVLVLEDVHWADPSSRDLLRFLLARLRTQRLLVVASYRSDDLHRRHPLRPLLAELARLPAVERLELRPFTLAEMRQHLTALRGRPVPEDVVVRVHERTEGNAFFAEELVAAAGAVGGGELPSGLLDVLLARLDALPPAVQQVARTAAVAGRRVDHALLQAVSGSDAAALEAALREAVVHQVLVPDGERYAFRHALLQEAVYGDLLPGERSRLHAAYARALAERGSSAAELAHHRLASHDLPGALEASVQAAQEATHLLAHAEALRHLERALELWAAVPDAAARSGLDQGGLVLRAAASASRAGDLDRAVALARTGLQLALASGDALAEGRARYVLAHHLLADDRDDEAVVEARRAAQLLAGDPHGAVKSGAVLARALLINADYGAARKVTDEALAAARARSLQPLEADLLATAAVLDEIEGDTVTAERHLEEAAALARASCDPATELRARYNLAAHHYYAGALTAALEVVEDAVRLAAHQGLTWSAFGMELRVLQVVGRYVAGDLRGSLESADLVGLRPPDVIAARLAAAACYAAVALGADDAAERLQALHDQWQVDTQVALIAGGCEADALTGAGRCREALDVLARAQERLEAGWGPHATGGIWLTALGLAAVADLAAEARLRGDETALRALLDEADALLQRAQVTARHGRTRVGELGPEGRAWLTRAEAEHARAADPAGPTAVAHWRAAVAAFGYGHAVEVARSRYRLAEALLAAGNAASAQQEAALAWRAARDLGARPLRTAVEALARRGRLDVGAGAVGDGPLTPREREVLALVARGRTNRQIGRELYISEKTASVHVSNILAKLSASGRAEAVAVAHRRGLLEIPSQREG